MDSSADVRFGILEPGSDLGGLCVGIRILYGHSLCMQNLASLRSIGGYPLASNFDTSGSDNDIPALVALAFLFRGRGQSRRFGENAGEMCAQLCIEGGERMSSCVCVCSCDEECVEDVSSGGHVVGVCDDDCDRLDETFG